MNKKVFGQLAFGFVLVWAISKIWTIPAEDSFNRTINQLLKNESSAWEQLKDDLARDNHAKY